MPFEDSHGRVDVHDGQFIHGRHRRVRNSRFRRRLATTPDPRAKLDREKNACNRVNPRFATSEFLASAAEHLRSLAGSVARNVIPRKTVMPAK